MTEVLAVPPDDGEEGGLGAVGLPIGLLSPGGLKHGVTGQLGGEFSEWTVCLCAELSGAPSSERVGGVTRCFPVRFQESTPEKPRTAYQVLPTHGETVEGRGHGCVIVRASGEYQRHLLG